METKVTTHIVKGLMLSALSIVFSIVVYVFNLYDITWLNWVNTGVLMAGLIVGNILYANQNNNNVTFGNLFAHGFKTIYTVIAFKFLFPDMIDKIIDISRKQMEKNPKMTDEMIEQAITMTKKFFMPFAIGGTILGTGFMGAVASLIGAGIAKKNPVDPFNNPTA
jgi:Protein of unknown function (DUF4199)